MSWQEVLTAKKENRHEIILSGNEISQRINKSGLDLTIFDLASLNYLNIHETTLSSIPDEIGKLVNLQTLVLHSNKIEQVTSKISELTKLKVLDLSRNSLKSIPGEVAGLLQLFTLNVSANQLETFPTFSKNTKLSVLELSNNNLKDFPDICYPDIANLSELRLTGNKIEQIPNKIGVLSSLKVFYVNSNEIKAIPGELSDCSKLKEINLNENPVSDKRLLKLIVQCHTKQVLDYIKQHCVRTSTTGSKTNKKGKKGSQNRADNEAGIEKQVQECTYKISVQHFTDSFKIIVQDDVKDVRAHIVACLVLNLEFSEETFKKFIQLQTKLHDTICDKRNSATIATHDWKKLGDGHLTYTAVPPNELRIKPLNRAQTMTGAQLFAKLQTEADNLRKEKKRNVYSGIHKYLYLLEGKAKYPCLLNSTTQEVISFPPITNSDTTKMSLDTKSLMIEVTSATSQQVCKKVADTLLKEMLPLFGKELLVQQLKNVDIEGNLKSVYPSRSDLCYDDHASILVERE